MRARGVLAGGVLACVLTLAVVLLALATLSASYAQAPPVRGVVEALRPREATVVMADVVFQSVTLVDANGNGRTDKAVVAFSIDGGVGGYVEVAVTLRDAGGEELDGGSRRLAVTVAGYYGVEVDLHDTADMAAVKSIKIAFRQVAG